MANWWESAPLADQQGGNWWEAAPLQQRGNAGVTRTPQEWADTENLPVPGTDWRTPEQPARFQSPIPGGDIMNEFARSFAENVPIVGPLVDRGADAVGSQIAAMITGQTPEETAEIGQMLRDRDASDQPIANVAGAVAGSVGPLMSLGQTKFGEQALGLTGPLWQRMAFGGGAGGLIAGGDALARGESPMDAAGQGAVGLGLGATMPLAERAVSPIARMLMGRPNPTPSTSKVAESLERSRIDPNDLPRMMDDLGPDAMLLDMSPNLTTQGGAIAATPGQGQTILRDAVTARQQGANARIQGDVDATLGPAPIPSRLAAEIRDNQRALGPAYEQAFANARAVDTSSLALDLDSLAVNLRGEAQNAVRQVRSMLDVAGNPGNLDPNPYTLFQTRQAIDGMLSGATDNNVRRVLTQARQSIDETLEKAVPGIKAADRQYAELARQAEGLETGASILSSGPASAIRPAELVDMLQSNTAIIGPSGVPFRISQGARAEIDRIIGTTANDVTALKGALKGDGSWNREKLASLYGRENADRLVGILEREQTFANSYNRIVGNSETAARQAAQKDVAPTEFNFDIQRLLFGIPERVANAGARSRSEAVNAQIAEMLIGRPSPELVNRLIAARQANRGLFGAAAVPLLTNQ